MALWGDIDITANLSGTVQTDGTAVVQGSSGFTAQLTVGEYVTFSNQAGVEYQVKRIIDADDFELTAVAGNTNASGLNVKRSEKPTYDNEDVFGINAAEAPGGVTPGWVKVTNGTGGRAGRTQYETLVAFGDHTKPSEASDADAGQFGELSFASNISGGTRTGQGTVAFAVTMTADNSLTPTYQWQKSTDAGATFANVTDGSASQSGTNNVTSTYTTASFADAAAAVDVQYRVVVSATGANSVTSDAGTVTIN